MSFSVINQYESYGNQKQHVWPCRHSGKDAARFVQHMNEDKTNPLALAALARGRELSEKINKGAAFRLELHNLIWNIV